MSRLTEQDHEDSRSAGVVFAQSVLSGMPEDEADAAIKEAGSLARRLAIKGGYTPEEQAELRHYFTEAAKVEWQWLSLVGGNVGHGSA